MLTVPVNRVFEGLCSVDKNVVQYSTVQHSTVLLLFCALHNMELDYNSVSVL
jgi:hypothetical protein